MFDYYQLKSAVTRLMVRFFSKGAHDEFSGEIQEDMAVDAGHSRMRCHDLGVRNDVMVPMQQT